MNKIVLIPVLLVSIAVSVASLYVRLSYSRKERPRIKIAAECLDIHRNPRLCRAIVDKPICGKVNIQCIKAPCEPVNQEFKNECEACANPLVKSFTYGKCEDK